MTPDEPFSNRPGLTEASFRRFEPAIREACLAFPAGVKVIIPDGLSELTVVARLRDAIRSLRLYQWPTDWDTSNVSKLTVHHNKDGVFVGKPTKQELVQKLAVKVADNPNGISLTLEQLKAFCCLISARYIEGPIVFRPTEDVDWDYIHAAYDVSVIPQEDRTYLLL